MLATPLSKYSIHLDILANTSSDHSIRLETQAAPIFKYSIRLDILANAAPDYPIRLETLATPLFNHPIRFGVLEMVKNYRNAVILSIAQGCRR